MRLIHLVHGEAVSPQEVWSAWAGNPGVAAGIALIAVLYSLGITRLWHEVGPGRSVAPWRAGCFAAGLLLLAVALLSPLDALAEALFAAHMVQHLLLMLVVPPLLVLGAPSRIMLWALPLDGRRSVGLWWNRRLLLSRLVSGLTHPGVAWISSVVALMLWHMPALYQAALTNGSIHAAEHLSFLFSGLLFWWAVLRPDGRRRLNEAVSVLYVFSAALPGGLLGALLTFAGRPLYPTQSAAARLWGLTPLEDQQLAGLIMWMPGGLIYLATAAALFLIWLREKESQSRRPSVVAGIPAQH